jgi:hypothetical protein
MNAILPGGERSNPTTRQAGNRARLSGSITINRLILRYNDFSHSYYASDEKPAKEYVEMKLAMRVVRELYGDRRADEFGPIALKRSAEDMSTR